MTRDDIYDHLAQVYLGKKKQSQEKKQPKHFHTWLAINILIVSIVVASLSYGLMAFLTNKKENLRAHIVYALHNGPIRLAYDFKQEAPPYTSFSLPLEDTDITKYDKIAFSVRAKEEGSPGLVKVVFRNKRNETASYYIQGVDFNWQEFSIPFSAFKQITDWGSIEELSFVLESWNVHKKSGLILINDVHFSS